MPETAEVRLNAAPLATQAGGYAGGGCLIAFGAPFVAIGFGLSYVLHEHPEQWHFKGPHMPFELIYGLLALFAIAGLFVWWQGLRGILGRLRADRVLRDNPDKPWLADRRWSPEGDRQRPFRDAIGSLVGLAFFALFLAPFHWWMSVEPWIPGYFIIGLFDLFLLAGIGFWFYSVGQALRYGAGWVRFQQFPFFLGEVLSVRLGCRGTLDRFDKLTVTLRFVHVRSEGSGRSRRSVAYQHWCDQQVFDRTLTAGQRELPVEFSLPNGDQGTQLADGQPRYWELEVAGEAPGIDYAARFMVPVYKRIHS